MHPHLGEVCPQGLGHDGGPGAARRLAPSLAEALRITTPAGRGKPSVRAELEALFGAAAPVGRMAGAVTPVGATAVFGGGCAQRPFAEAGGDCVQRPFAEVGAGRRAR